MPTPPTPRPSRAATAALAITLAACGVPPPAPEPLPPLVLQDESMAVAVLHGAGGIEAVELRGRTPDLTLPVARIGGVRLVLAAPDGSPQPTLLPFRTAYETASGGLALRCALQRDHEIEVRIESAAAGEVRIEVRDDVGIRSEVLELTIDLELVGDAPVDEHAAPHVHTGADELAGDLAFDAPVAFLRAGARALGLIPDLQLLAADRRIPQGIEVRVAPRPSIRHGLIAQRVERDGGFARFTRDGAPAVQVRAEPLRFAFYARALADATPHRSLAALHATLFAREAAGALARSAAPLGGTGWELLCERLVDGPVDAAWRELPGIPAGIASGCYATPRAAASFETRFEVRDQTLRTAWGELAWSLRRGDADAHRAANAIRLALAAPRRGGMIPNRLLVEAGGAMTWRTTEPGEALLPEHYHAFDGACTGIWLLRLSDHVPELRAPILDATAELARFFVQNQRASGSIPSYYDPQYLLPRREVFDDASPECGAAALFLAEFARRRPDEAAAEGARRAVRFLAAHTHAQNAWPDFETLVAGDEPLPRPAPGASGTLATIFAARAAFAIAAADGEPSYAELGAGFCDRIAALQRVWSPQWLGPAPRGSVRATDLELGAAHPHTALAAEAFLDGYLATGRRELLQRGALALRAGLLAGPEADAGAALAAAERCRQHLGQGVVDVGGGFAEGLDAIWFEDVQIEAGRCSLRLLTEVDEVGPVRVVFRNLTEPAGSLELVVDGEPAGSWTADELRRGIELTPRRVARFRFDPPRSIRHGAPWRLRAEFDGPLPLDARTWIEYAPRGRTDNPARVELEKGTGSTLVVAGPDAEATMGLAVGTVIEARLVHEEAGGRRVVVPARGFRAITVDTMDCIDVGDDDEAELEDAGTSSVVRDPEGRENARHIEAPGHATWSVPVPRSAAELALSIRLAGAARITTGAHLLHADEQPSESVRELSLQLADPRLWRTGTLPLTIAANDPAGCTVARIRYLASGSNEPADEVMAAEPERRPDARLRVLVVPVSFADASLRVERGVLERVFFGGDDYRMTPAPEPRLTAGSVAGLVAEFSGGISELRGEVLPALELPIGIAELGAASLRDAVRERLAGRFEPERLDAVVVVHPGPAAEPGPAELDGLPLIALPESSPDGSVLASGTAVLEILDRIYGFEPLARPEFGSFGEFALSASGGGHVPAALGGINLVRTGWADTVRVPNPGQGALPLTLAPLEVGRARLRLACDLLPDRGDLFLETQRPSSDDPWAPSGGALVYWSFPEGAAPLVVGADAPGCRVRNLRLSPARPTWRTPFAPADSRDLFRAADRLDVAATPQGELVWAIRRLRTREPDGATQLWLEYLPRDLLASAEPGWLTGIGAALAPMPAAPGADVGRARRTDAGFELAARPEVQGALRGRFTVPGADAPRRLFGVLDGLAGAGLRVRVAVDGRVAVAMEAGSSFALDLPPSLAPTAVDLDVLRVRASDSVCTLTRLVVLPLAVGASPVRLPERARSTLLTDGVAYAETGVVRVDARGAASRRVPVLLPSGPSALRLVCGQRADSPPEDIRLTISRDGRALVDRLLVPAAAGDRAPLTTVIAELAASGEGGLAMLDLTLEGPPHAELHVVAMSVERW